MVMLSFIGTVIKNLVLDKLHRYIYFFLFISFVPETENGLEL